MTSRTALGTAFLAGAVLVAFGQGASKGYLSPSAGKNVDSQAYSKDGMVNITESADIPSEQKYNCNGESGNVGIVYASTPDGSAAQGTKMLADAIHQQVAAGNPVDGEKLQETSVDGASVFYAEKTEPCIESSNPSRKILKFDAFWANDKASVHAGISGVSLETAKKYLHEVIQKAKALDSASVKNN